MLVFTAFVVWSLHVASFLNRFVVLQIKKRGNTESLDSLKFTSRPHSGEKTRHKPKCSQLTSQVAFVSALMVPSSLPCCEIRSWSSPWRGVCLNQDPCADTQAEWTNETWQRPGESLLGLGSWWAYRDMAIYTKLTSLISLLILFCLLLTLVGLPTFRRSISFLNTVRKKRRGGREADCSPC